MVHRPPILILDEPTAGVDIELRVQLWDYVRKLNENGTTIILTTHYLEEAEILCRSVAIINHGKIVTQGSIKDLLRDLNSETFLLDTQNALPHGIQVPGFSLRQVEPQCLEVDLAKRGAPTAPRTVPQAGLRGLALTVVNGGTAVSHLRKSWAESKNNIITMLKF